MKTKIITSLVICLLCLPLASSAQTLSRFVIGSTGSIDGPLIFTVGEAVIESGTAGDLVLTQGFQQPDKLIGTFIDPFVGKLSFHLYPNPAKEELFLELAPNQNFNLLISVSDARGRKIVPDRKLNIQEKKTINFDVSSLAAGSYLMILQPVGTAISKVLRFQKID